MDHTTLSPHWEGVDRQPLVVIRCEPVRTPEQVEEELARRKKLAESQATQATPDLPGHW